MMARPGDILAAARRTVFYGPDLEDLAAAPVISIEEFYAHRSTFRDPAGQLRTREFQYPLQAVPDVAVLIDGFKPSEHVRMISDMSREELATLSGWAIAAPVGLLRDLAVSRCALEYPVVAFTGPRFGPLTAADRDLFWKAYEVPVYEQVLGIANEVLAEECDGHDGLHVRDAWFESIDGQLVATPFQSGTHVVLRLATGLDGDITEDPCACGRAGLRLVNLEPVRRTSAAKA